MWQLYRYILIKISILDIKKPITFTSIDTRIQLNFALSNLLVLKIDSLIYLLEQNLAFHLLKLNS